MRGLLLKDIALMRNQMKSFVVILAAAVIMMVFNDDVVLPVAYVCMVFAMFGINSISYDDFDKGYSFLFTLPIKRRQYVLSKYVFSLLSILTGALMSAIFMVAVLTFKGEMHTLAQQIDFLIGYSAGAMVFLSVMLPIQLKYGAEKGRIALVVIAGVIVAAAFLIERIPMNFDVLVLLVKINAMNDAVLSGIVTLLCICIVAISYLISCRVMEKKEF